MLKSNTMGIPKVPNSCVRRVVWYAPLCIFAFISFGCVAMLIDRPKGIDGFRNAAFRIGGVQVAVYISSPDPHLSEKEQALARIPLKAVCETLSEWYGIKIDTNVDTTPKIGKESLTRHASTETVYYGNLKYLYGSANDLIMKERMKTEPAFVNVRYYALAWPIWPFFPEDHCSRYEITLRLQRRLLIKLHGVVKSIAPERFWEDFVDSAEYIDEALKRDLTEASKKH